MSQRLRSESNRFWANVNCGVAIYGIVAAIVVFVLRLFGVLPTVPPEVAHGIFIALVVFCLLLIPPAVHASRENLN
jgi:hypothetical protein